MARILAVLPDYPPLHRGGWEWGAYEVNEMWASMGHAVTVLTNSSADGAAEISQKQSVLRLLPVPPPACRPTDLSLQKRFALRAAASNALSVFNQVLDEVRPDFVMIWILSTYPTGLFSELARRGIPNLHYLSNYGAPTQLFRHPTLLGRIQREAGRWWLKAGTVNRHEIEWSRAVYCSEFVRAHHVRMDPRCVAGHVVHWGVNHTHYHRGPERLPGEPLRLVWAGRIHPEKGLHVAVDAMRGLGTDVARLDIYGCIDDESYYRSAIEPHLREGINYRGFLRRGELAGVLIAADAFVFTSIWPEPFSVVVLEALAAGLALLATETGGTRECLNDDCALFTRAGDGQALAKVIKVLSGDAVRLQRMRDGARRRSYDFTIQAMAEKLLQVGGVNGGLPWRANRDQSAVHFHFGSR